MHTFAENDRSYGTDRSGSDCGTNDSGRMNAAVLLAVSDNIYRNQLQGRNIDDQKITHFVTGSTGERGSVV